MNLKDLAIEKSFDSTLVLLRPMICFEGKIKRNLGSDKGTMNVRSSLSCFAVTI